jgi:anti-anti-sigma factor
MQLRTSQEGEVLVIDINDRRLDRNNSGRFKQEITAYLRPGIKIALGLSEVRYVDGLGYGAMLALERETTALRGEVRLFSLHQPVRTLFQKLRLHRRLHTHNAREEAVRALAGPV